MPLAIPLVAGPTILATLMLLSHQYPNQMGHLVIALLLAWGGTFVILLQSSLFLRLLAHRIDCQIPFTTDFCRHIGRCAIGSAMFG